MRIWKQHIDPELIDMFLDRLFEKCKCSIFEMERVMQDLACSDNLNHLYKDELEEICKECDDVHHLEETVDNLGDDINSLKDDIKGNIQLYLDMKKKYNFLKKNAVVFTMDEWGE